MFNLHYVVLFVLNIYKCTPNAYRYLESLRVNTNVFSVCCYRGETSAENTVADRQAHKVASHCELVGLLSQQKLSSQYQCWGLSGYCG